MLPRADDDGMILIFGVRSFTYNKISAAALPIQMLLSSLLHKLFDSECVAVSVSRESSDKRPGDSLFDTAPPAPSRQKM